jgi:deoxyribodipyrimidine photo-lyase
MFENTRKRSLNDKPVQNGPVIYWMSRDQRVQDNWALNYALQEANAKKQKLVVVFTLVPNFLEASWRQYDFMLEGLKQVEKNLNSLKVPLVLLVGSNPSESVIRFVRQNKVGLAVSDLSPVRIVRNWKDEVSKKINCLHVEIDTHNIIPVWETSGKQEFAARTIRPKIKKKMDQYLTEIPAPKKLENSSLDLAQKNDWDNLKTFLQVDFTIKPVEWLVSGESAAQEVFRDFIHKRLQFYKTGKNDPNQKVVSNLSPYFHFGQLSSQRVAYEITTQGFDENVESFLEELIVRRELAENYCFYNSEYDSYEGFPDWGKRTLDNHLWDERKYQYNLEQFEQAKTHDDLWNAAQIEMVSTGKMHGYMRMYWAKKILEWSSDPQTALQSAIHLNDKYELDGRDPNGWANIAWCIGGLHDRPWPERPIYGKVRYMTKSGCERKFDTKKYIERNLSSSDPLF